MRAVVAAEWTKIRTVRSTVWTLLATVAVCVGLSVLVGLSFRSAFPTLPQTQQDRFDPLFATFYGLTLGQLPLVVFAVLTVTAEYSSGTVRASLLAVPRRGLAYAGKLLAAALVMSGVAVVAVVVSFFTAQAALGPYATSIGADGVPTAVVGACLYLTLIGLFAVGVAMMLRGSTRTLAVLLPLLFLGSQGLGNVPRVKVVTQYLPDQVGAVILHLTGPAGDPQFGRPYGPWAGVGMLVGWSAAALLGGYLVLRRRDA